MTQSIAAPTPVPIALVTGGSRGLGRSTALALAARGVDVIITYKSSEAEARRVVADIEAQGRRAVALPLDVGQSATFEAFADTVRATLARVWRRDRLDYLVNNAGTTLFAPFLETTEAQLDELLAIHVKATFLLSQRLVPLIADGGRILNVSSGLTRYTYPGQAAYALAKGAVDVLTRYMAVELGTRRISVNVIAPGGIETDIGGGVMRRPDVQAMVTAETALGRVGQPEDIGAAVALLLASETQWINGQRLEVTGGFRL
jgi:NAD(P)-dependent dehydrogenase (short-subunit alcohol dehydrogenase family)